MQNDILAGQETGGVERSPSSVPVNERVGATDLRAALARPTARWMTLVAALFLGAGVATFTATARWWALPSLGLALLLLLLGALPAVPLTRRLRFIHGAFVLGGLTHLVFAGWSAVVAVALLVALVYAALFWRVAWSRALWGFLSFVTLGVVLAEGMGLGLPLAAASTGAGWAGLLYGWGLFAVFGGLSIAGCTWLLHHVGHLLQEERRQAAVLDERQARAQQRAEVLQEANASLQRRTTYLEASASVAQLLTTVFELGVLLNRAAELTAEVFGLDHVGVYLMDETRAWAVLRAASSTTGKEMVLRTYRIGASEANVVGWVARHGRPRMVRGTDAGDVPLANAGLPMTRSEMALPLMVNEELLGVLDLQSREVAAFEPDDMRTLAGLARHLALAIHNARRLSGEAAVLEAASPFYRATNRLAAARTEGEVYRVVVETLQEFGPAHTYVIRGVDYSAELYVVASREDEDVDLTPRNVASLPLPGVLDALIIGLALASPLWAEDLSDLPSDLSPELAGALTDLAESTDIGALAFVPLRVAVRGGEGGIFVLYTTAHRFTPLERRLHQWLAELGGVALERSHLLAQARAHLERERLLAEVRTRLRASLDPDVVGQAAARELGRLLDAEAVSIEVQDADGAVGSLSTSYLFDGEDVTPQPLSGVESGSEALHRLEQPDLRLPLGRAGDVLGHIAVVMKADQDRLSLDAELAETVADEIYRALERARCFRSMQDARVEAEVLHEGSHAIPDASTAGEVLHAIAMLLPSSVMDRAVLVSRHEYAGLEAPAISVEAAWRAGEAGELPGVEVDRRWPLDAWPVLAAVADAPLVIPDVAAAAMPEAAKLLEVLGFRAVIVLPLNAGRLLGWLLLGSTCEAHPFTRREVRLYRSLAEQAAAMLYGFDLRRLAAERAEREELVALMGARIRSSTDVDTILQNAIRELGGLLEADDGEIRLQPPSGRDRAEGEGQDVEAADAADDVVVDDAATSGERDDESPADAVSAEPKAEAGAEGLDDA